METKTPPTLVSVYNRSDRSFIHGKHTAAPRTFSDAPADVVAVWLKNYPQDIVERGVATKELNGVHAELAEVRGKLVTAEARVKELEASLKALRAGTDALIPASIAEQKMRIAELETQLAALAPKEPKGKKSAAADAV